MKTQITTLLSAALLAAAAAPATAQTPAQTPTAPAPAAVAADSPLGTLLRDALFEEEATRDLTKAAAGYEALLAHWAAQRPTAAAALYRLAEVRRKQDRKDDAIALYQRLLREFSDVEPHAKLSRENLTALDAKARVDFMTNELPGKLNAADPLLTDEEANALQRVKKLAAQSPDLLIGQEFSNACSKGWLTVVQLLVSKGITDDGGGFVSAAQNGHLAVVTELMKQKPLPDYLATAVCVAAENNRIAVLKLLLESGASADGSSEMDRPLSNALNGGYKEAAELLLAHKANPDPVTAWASPLFTAARTQNVTMVQRLLELKADPNRATKEERGPDNGNGIENRLTRPVGATPLHAAVFASNAEIIKLLLDAKANPNAQNALGVTPLFGAVIQKNLPLVEQLLAAGADPNLASKENETPLLRAVMLQQRDIAALLFKAKADPNALCGKTKDATAFAHVFNNKDEAELTPWITLFLEHAADPFAGQTSAARVAPAAWRIKFLRSHKYPALAGTPAITLVLGNDLQINPLQERKDDKEAPGTLPALLTAWNEKGGWTLGDGSHQPFAADWSTLRLWRKGADGKMQETVIEVKKDTAWPELQWGDVVELLAPIPDPAAADSPAALPRARRVQVQPANNQQPASAIPPETLELLKPAK